MRVAFRFLYVIAMLGAAGCAEQLPIRAYTTADGLAHNHINCIRQDSKGFLWFCTDEGLTRFDGYQLISFTVREGLPHPWINDLIESRDGTLWIASDGGVSRFNPKRSSSGEAVFVTYVPDQHPDARRVNALAEDASGAIWCATYNGLYRLDRVGANVRFSWVDIRLPDDVTEGRLINKLAFDQQGTLWLTARTGLYRRLADGRAERYTMHNGLPDNFTGDLLQDRNGSWWVATRLGGFCRIGAQPDPDRRVVERCYSTSDGLPHNDVRAIFQSSDGRIWIGTILGLSEFTPEAAPGKLFRNYTLGNGLSEAQIFRIAEDQDGNLWIGTRRGGVMKMPRHGFVRYGSADGFRSGTTHHTVFENTRGKLCVLTGTGSGAIIQQLEGSKFVATRLKLLRAGGTENVFIEQGFQSRTGEWWLATRHGLIRFPKTKHVEDLARVRPRIYTVADGLITNLIDDIYQDSHGGIWVATTHEPLQLRRWDSAADKLRLYAADKAGVRPANSGPVAAIAEDSSGDLWLGFRNCLARCRKGHFEWFFTGSSAIHGPVNALHLDRLGRLWIASALGGLYRMDEPASAHPHITRYAITEGLSSNEILCLTEDQWGRIYAGTNRGVDRLDPGSSVVHHYTAADGLSLGAVALAYRDHEGALWFVTDEGISRLIPARDALPTPPPILITGLRILGVSQPVSPVGQVQIQSLILAPNHNQLQIDFVGLNFRPGVALRYQYKLDGADRDWSAPTAERSVNYASIAPGLYRFLVRAISSDGLVSRQSAVVMFTVRPPLWRRWWFLALCGLVASVAIYRVHRSRVDRLLAVERIRTRIATDLHDDIGASLSHIAVLSEVVANRIRQMGVTPDGQPLYESLSRIGSVSRELIDSMSDIVWAISPRKDQVCSLTQRMHEFAAEVLGPRGIEFRLDSVSIDHEMRLDPEVRRQVFLIFKECVNNTLRHSGSTSVVCDFRLEQGSLTLRLSDNGRGFSATANGSEGTGQGLMSMRSRAEALGGELVVASEDSLGVKVTVRVPPRRRSLWFLSHHLNR